MRITDAPSLPASSTAWREATVEIVHLPKAAPTSRLASQFAAALNEDGSQSLIANTCSRAMVMRCGQTELPITIENGEYGLSYVASPHSAYVLYARDEINILNLRAGRYPARATLGLLDQLLRALRINQSVHLDNWLLSTNLHGDWTGQGLKQMRQLLAAKFPDRLLMIRSLDPWSCGDLLRAVEGDGWILLPARQIWVTDDLRQHWKRRNNTQNDRRMLKKSGLRIEEPETIAPADALRIADLYRQLYLGRYSALNPIYTAKFVEIAAKLGLLHFRVARDHRGEVRCFAALRKAGDLATIPMLGYDTSMPQEQGLYRIACYAAGEWAMERDLRLHGSAGAGKFKALRGARSEIEYTAVDARHLSGARQLALRGLAKTLRAVMVPMLKRQGW